MCACMGVAGYVSVCLSVCLYVCLSICLSPQGLIIIVLCASFLLVFLSLRLFCVGELYEFLFKRVHVRFLSYTRMLL